MKIIFVTSVTHTPNQKNLNHWQRVYFLSRSAELTILGAKGSNFDASAGNYARVWHGAAPGKLGILLSVLRLAISGQARKFDIVLTEPSFLGLAGFVLKIAGCRRWVVDVWDIPGRYQNRGHTSDKFRRALARTLLTAIYRFADCFLVSIRPDFELRRFAIPREKMVLCKNAIWLDAVPNNVPDPGELPVVLCMRSEHTWEMGLDVLAAAVPLLEKRFPEVEFLIVGRIPEHVGGQIVALRGKRNVEFINFMDHDALLERIRSASVCVIPFRDVDDLRQTYPVKVLEYMAQAKAVVASNLPGIEDMIDDGVNGLLFTAGDPADLAERVSLVLSDEELRRRLSRSALEGVQTYDCAEKNRYIIDALKALVEKD